MLACVRVLDLDRDRLETGFNQQVEPGLSREQPEGVVVVHDPRGSARLAQDHGEVDFEARVARGRARTSTRDIGAIVRLIVLDSPSISAERSVSGNLVFMWLALFPPPEPSSRSVRALPSLAASITLM